MPFPPGWTEEGQGLYETYAGSLGEVVAGEPNGALYVSEELPLFMLRQSYDIIAFTVSGGGGGGGEPCEPRTARDVFPNNAPQAALAGGQDKFVALEWLANDDGALWLNDDGTESLPA